MELTRAQFDACLVGASQSDRDKYYLPLTLAMSKEGIDTPNRIAFFLAQVAHESGNLRQVEENLNYSANGLLKTFPRHFSYGNAFIYERKPVKIASRAYANRMGNSDEASGDGWNHRGFGLIQVTGKKNQDACCSYLGIDTGKPDRLMLPENASRSAAWFFAVHTTCLLSADTDDFKACTRKINGGLIGLYAREKLLAKIRSVIGSGT